MQLYTLDPLQEPRWDHLAASHPRSSVFHQSGWLRALARTYGYRPVALTTTPAGNALVDGVVFCEVRSWITGKRLVSLPFSDHLDPLLNDASNLFDVPQWIQSTLGENRYRYLELRPLTSLPGTNSLFRPAQTFWWHTLDLRPPLRQLFDNLHKGCFQRRIRHAEHEHLEYQRGSSEGFVREFYNLLLTTRRRHQMLPQPYTWFMNLISERALMPEIRLVRKNCTAVAALFTLRHRGTVVYKYGCSDEKFHHLGSMPFLFWRLIEESKSEDADQIDLGRTEVGNRGLLEFKNRLGSSSRKISYLRYPQDEKRNWMEPSRLSALRRIASSVPNPLLAGMGRLAYRHFG